MTLQGFISTDKLAEGEKFRHKTRFYGSTLNINDKIYISYIAINPDEYFILYWVVNYTISSCRLGNIMYYATELSNNIYNILDNGHANGLEKIHPAINIPANQFKINYYIVVDLDKTTKELFNQSNLDYMEKRKLALSFENILKRQNCLDAIFYCNYNQIKKIHDCNSTVLKVISNLW